MAVCKDKTSSDVYRTVLCIVRTIRKLSTTVSFIFLTALFSFFIGPASSCSAQEAFSNWPVLPHLWPGGFPVRTGAGLRLHLSLLLYTSSQFTLLSRTLLAALNTKRHSHVLTQLCCAHLADPRRQLVPLPCCLRGLCLRSSEGAART